MSPQILIGLYTEGTTDVRFLTSIIKRTFEEISYECKGEIEILDIQNFKIAKTTFAEDVVEAIKAGTKNYGITILCIHADADDSTETNCFQNRINPAMAEVENLKENDICKIIVPLIPVQMTESWMLADKELLKREIGTSKTNQELDIYKHPEQYANPKETIENAIRIARQEKTKRHRRELKIADLYLPIGQSVDLNKLKQLTSYIKFQENVRNALVKLNYL